MLDKTVLIVFVAGIFGAALRGGRDRGSRWLLTREGIYSAGGAGLVGTLVIIAGIVVLLEGFGKPIISETALHGIPGILSTGVLAAILGYIWGNSPNKVEVSAAQFEAARQLVAAYGAVLAAERPAELMSLLRDTRDLPAPKNALKEALRIVLPHAIGDRELMLALTFAWTALADFQDGVREKPVGMILRKGMSPAEFLQANPPDAWERSQKLQQASLNESIVLSAEVSAATKAAIPPKIKYLFTMPEAERAAINVALRNQDQALQSALKGTGRLAGSLSDEGGKPPSGTA